MGGSGGVGGEQGGTGGTGQGSRVTYGDIHAQNFTVNVYVDPASSKHCFSITENLTVATPERF
jgi:hypothetical protein